MANRRQLLPLVARAAAGARPLRHRAACAALWQRLARNFDIVVCVLMPNHVHVLASIDSDTVLRTFARVLSAFRSRMAGTPGTPAMQGMQRALATPATLASAATFDWEPLPVPEKVQRDKRHIARAVRYIHLNPVRDGLCADPLDWEWSTHRDWMGAVARPCVDRARWARAMGRREESCPDWLHEYVSADPSVRSPRPLGDPTPFLRESPKDASLDAHTIAVPRVLRSRHSMPHEFGGAERALFLLSAARWTHYRPPELARHVDLHPMNVRKAIRRDEGMSAEALRAMALTLADPRLSAEWRPRSMPQVRDASNDPAPTPCGR